MVSLIKFSNRKVIALPTLIVDAGTPHKIVSDHGDVSETILEKHYDKTSSASGYVDAGPTSWRRLGDG